MTMSFFSPMMLFFVVFPFLSFFVFGMAGTLLFRKHGLWSMPLTVLCLLVIFMFCIDSAAPDFIVWLISFPLLTLLAAGVTLWIKSLYELQSQLYRTFEKSYPLKSSGVMKKFAMPTSPYNKSISSSESICKSMMGCSLYAYSNRMNQRIQLSLCSRIAQTENL
jgi:hypothetical protein